MLDNRMIGNETKKDSKLNNVNKFDETIFVNENILNLRSSITSFRNVLNSLKLPKYIHKIFWILLSHKSNREQIRTGIINAPKWFNQNQILHEFSITRVSVLFFSFQIYITTVLIRSYSKRKPFNPVTTFTVESSYFSNTKQNETKQSKRIQYNIRFKENNRKYLQIHKRLVCLKKS